MAITKRLKFLKKLRILPNELGVELLASGKRLIVLNQFEDIIGHHVVAAPRHIGQRLVDDGRHHIDILLEYLARIHLTL